MNAIAIVAHHDDAVLWCGGTILKTQYECGWEWTIVVFCLPDPKKKSYFNNYCKTFNIKESSFNYEDYQDGNIFCKNQKDSMVNDLRETIKNNSYDLVFTHSIDPNGEYGGHINHNEVLDVVKEVFLSENIINFSYNPEFGYNGRATVARIDSDFHVQLNYDELINKATWCRNAPDAEDSLKAIGYPCPNPEGFRNKNKSLNKFDKIFLRK